MKISEVINEDLEEGWKSNLAKLGAGAALALGSPTPVNLNHEVPQLIQKIKQSNPAKVLLNLATLSGIQGNELSALMSQAAHETLDFTRMVEKGTSEYFHKKYENPRMAKKLGNVDTEGDVIPGSGEKYKGRGPLQITGKYNYAKIGKALNLPLEEHPEMLEDPEIGAKASLWYWKHRVAPKVKDFGNVKQVTKTINPGMAGLKSRQHHLKKYNAKIEKDKQDDQSIKKGP